MNLTERLDVLISESAGHQSPFFYRLLDLTRELAKRIEALERREHIRSLHVGQPRFAGDLTARDEADGRDSHRS